MADALSGIGQYRSPTGGALAPYRIPEGTLLFELITGGAVYPPSGEVLHGPGWVFVHQPGQHTIWQTDPGCHYECMTATFNLAQVRKSESWPRAFFWEDTTGVASFAHEMLYAFHHTNADRTVLGNYIWSQFRFRLDHFRRQKIRQEIPSRLAVVMNFIDRHYAEAIDLESMAAQVEISVSHLHALFRDTVKLSPHQYLIRQRMRAARHALATTTSPIKAIALDVGYTNTENFCRAFRQHYHITAATYRRKYMIYGNG